MPGWGREASNHQLRARERASGSEPRLQLPGPEPSGAPESRARASRRALPDDDERPQLPEQPQRGGLCAEPLSPSRRTERRAGELRIMAAGKFASLPRNMPMNHQFPLASSMDLLSSKSPLVNHHTDAYQDVSIHGTLPRKKKGPPPIRSCDNFSHMGTLPHSKSPRQNSPLTQDIIQEHPLQDWIGETFTSR